MTVSPNPGDGSTGPTVGIGVGDDGSSDEDPPGEPNQQGPSNGCERVPNSAECVSPCLNAPESQACEYWAIQDACRNGEQKLLPPGACDTQVVPPPTAADLAQAAYGELTFAAVTPERYPSGTLPDGRGYTVVNAYTWFWVSTTSWHADPKTVCTPGGALCATAIATPTILTFDPGDGASAVSCDGPGMPWHRQASGSWVPERQPDGCDYRYTRSTFGAPSGVLTARYSITWTVTWTGTNGTSGTLAPLQTTATSTFAVAELQSVVIR